MFSNIEDLLRKTAGKKTFSMLDWGIHFGIFMNLVVVAYIIYYVISH